MRTEAKILAWFFLILSVFARNISAEVITIGLTAEIKFIDDRLDLLDEQISVGQIITGSYIYDSDTPDTNPLPTVGGYYHATPPYGITLTVGDLVFQSDPDNLRFLVEVWNDHIGEDGYYIESDNNLPLPNGVEIFRIGWELQDFSGTALSSVDLPTTPPLLEMWDYDYGLRVRFGEKGHSYLVAEVTSVFAEPAIIYVDADASGANDGSSWANAYNDLQDGLADANSSAKPVEIRVAQGTYTPFSLRPPGRASNPNPPDGATDINVPMPLSWTGGVRADNHCVHFGTSSPPPYIRCQTDTIFFPDRLDDYTKYYWRIDSVNMWGITPGTMWCFTTGEIVLPPPPPPPSANSNGQRTSPVIDRAATFQLINGVVIEGGYAGFGQPDPNVRDINIYKTILSGDLGGDDVGPFNHSSRRENSYHVVTGSGTDATAVLDGFTITAGYDDRKQGYYSIGHGSGMLNEYGSPTVSNCTFIANFAGDTGAGMFNGSGSPTVTDCTFSANYATWAGGGMFNLDSSPTVTNCTFSDNSAEKWGGAICNLEASNPMLSNCTFSGNSAGNGGGINNGDSSPTLTNCVFTGNFAPGLYGEGAGMYNMRSSPRLTNCTFIGNKADRSGGAMLISGRNGVPVLTNCTFSGNKADLRGPAMVISGYGTPVLKNCIVWDGADGIWDSGGSVITISYSDVQGGWPGEGNIDADPCFVWPEYLSPIAYWKLDESAGTTAYDSAGDNHATIHGATWTSGQVKGALDFDGVDDYVDIPYHSSLDINASEGITLAVWIKLHSHPDSTHQGPIFGLFDSTGAGTKNYLGIGKSIYGNVISWDQWPPSYGSIDSIKPDLDTWYHIAVVEDSSHRAIYINGCLDSSDNLSESYEGNTPDTIRIGSRADAWAPFYFHGAIDEVIMFDRALSDEEVSQVYELRVWGDYRLQPDSPCIDVGDNNSVPADVNDIDGDGDVNEPIPFDLDGNPRVADGDGDGIPIVDMGAYEAASPYVSCCFAVNHLKIDASHLKCKGVTLLEVTSDQGVFVYLPDPGKDKLKKETIVDDGVNGPVKIHTSGSKPLEIGDVFGAYTVTRVEKIFDSRPRKKKKGDDIDIKGTFKPFVPVDLSADEVTYIIDDGQGHTLDFTIPAGLFRSDGKKHEDRKCKFKSPKGSYPELDARFDFTGCKFDLKVKRVYDLRDLAGRTFTVALFVGTNLGEETVKVRLKGHHLEHNKKRKLDCCGE